MTDKDIINHGINVSKCSLYNPLGNYACGGRKCEDNPNCYYKQLSCKTAECEELKKTILTKCPNCNSEYLTSKGIELYEENQNLKQECEELKAQLNDMACMDDDNVLCYPRQELKKEYDEYVLTHKYSNEEFQQERKAVADLAFWSNRYKRGLEEIEKELKEDINCESQECGCNDFEECLKCTKVYILDIINKAKEQ